MRIAGTHKAMVLLWLQRNDLMNCKAYLYGRTRSWSLIGSGVSAVSSVGIMMLVQSAQEDIFRKTAESSRCDRFLPSR